jgi:hypothetical protein
MFPSEVTNPKFRYSLDGRYLWRYYHQEIIHEAEMMEAGLPMFGMMSSIFGMFK